MSRFRSHGHVHVHVHVACILCPIHRTLLICSCSLHGGVPICGAITMWLASASACPCSTVSTRNV